MKRYFLLLTFALFGFGMGYSHEYEYDEYENRNIFEKIGIGLRSGEYCEVCGFPADHTPGPACMENMGDPGSGGGMDPQDPGPVPAENYLFMLGLLGLASIIQRKHRGKTL